MSDKINWDAPSRFIEHADNPMPKAARVDVGMLRARDGAMLRNAVFAPDSPRGTVVLMTGYSEFIEKYFETICDLMAMGYAVVMPEWRAHGLSGGGGSEPTRLFIDDFDMNVTDLEDRWEKLVAPMPKPHFGLAHSMGGLISLRAAHAHPDWFEKLAQSAPMLGLNLPAWVNVIMQFVVWTYAIRGKLDAWNLLDPPATRPSDAATNRITSDLVRFQRNENLFMTEPQLQINGRAPGWLRAAGRAMRDTARPAYLKQITTPLFIGSAEKEALVANAAHDKALAHLPNGKGAFYAASMHELVMEKDAIRQAFLADVKAFFEA